LDISSDDIVGKVNIKNKLHEIAYFDMASLCALMSKVKIKGVEKGCVTKFARSTKRIPSYFEHVDALHAQHDSSST